MLMFAGFFTKMKAELSQTGRHQKIVLRTNSSGTNSPDQWEESPKSSNTLRSTPTKKELDDKWKKLLGM
jgi:hypothetical protein